MKKEQALQLIGIATFLLVTILTYGVVTPVSKTTNASLEVVTNKIINTTTNTTTDSIEDNRLANNYHILTAVTVGVVLAIVVVFFLGFW